MKRSQSSPFDDLGRPVLVTENAEGPADDQRHTAYLYDEKTGQLAKVAAVRHTHDFDDGEVVWAADDGSLQVTRCEYDAGG